MPIVTLPGNGLSRSAEMRSKFWIKRLDRVDTSKSDGYAFIGTFTRFGATVEVPEGTWFLANVQDVSSSGRLRGYWVSLYQAADGEVTPVKVWSLNENPGWALKVRDEIAELISAPPSVDELLAEREQLLARLAEIDKLLPEPEGATVGTREAAQILGVSVRTVQRWAAAGKVAAAKDSDGRWTITITVNPNQ